MPPKEVYEPLMDVFFDALAQHFPSIQRLRLQNRLADGTMSAFLLNGELGWVRGMSAISLTLSCRCSSVRDIGEVR